MADHGVDPAAVPQCPFDVVQFPQIAVGARDVTTTPRHPFAKTRHMTVQRADALLLCEG